ncbi:MAG: hypothetical protein JWM85_1965 [Acidimicrobiaceae bacterium]|nr:hypothetical protein [Acidimicrobiaceae bacterium]
MSSSSVSVSPERVAIELGALDELRARLARTRLPPTGTDDWSRGVPLGWLEELLAEWQTFDVGAFQARLDELTHVRAEIDGHSVHAVHLVGRGERPLPLLLTHGWPGSFCEYLDLLPLLVDPAAHGGDPADAFSVIVPALPGFAFSGPPAPALTRQGVAELWNRLVVEGLGYERYVAHGSDIGSGVTAWLARTHPEAVGAIHLATPGLAVAPEPRTSAEETYTAAVQAWSAEEGGYAHEHSTKPSTLAVGLTDSPAGLAAWIAEKVVAWSAKTEDGSPAFSRDLLLGTLTLYWVTHTIGSSLLPYWAHLHLPGGPLPIDDPSPVPTALSIFGGERVPFPKPPRELAERYFNVTSWAEHDRGGHFPAVAEPELLAATLRDAFRPFRNA